MTETSKKINYLTITAIVISGSAIPTSTAAQNIGAALLIIAFLLTPKTWSQIKYACTQPFGRAGLFLGLLLALGTLWSSASSAVAWGFFLKMRAYYLIPIFILICKEGKMRNYLILSFVVVTFLSVILSCTSAYFNHPILMAEPGDWFIFRTHTYHNFFAALLGTGILATLISKKIPRIYQIILVVILICVSYDILFLVAGRTGQIAYLSMIFLTFILWNWRLGLLLSLIFASALILILPNHSPVFISGLKNAESNLTAYSQGDANTSVGLRLEWQKNSIRLIREKPFFGHGTGSFRGEYERVLGLGDKALMSHNPHNDYLWLGVELGVFGSLALLILMLAAAWQGRHLQPAWKWTLYSLLLGMGISTTANSFFTDNITGLAFVLLSCALLSGPTIKGGVE
jgi:O-antigen ligase